jgi:aminomethyltransferase
MTDLQHSPLESAHLALGAKLVPFAGWYMPVQYTSILDEHHAVRRDAGIFDISHMGQFIVEGPKAAEWLNKMLTNDIDALTIGTGQYSLMLNHAGGVIDDLILYRSGESSYFLVVNASMIEQDRTWMENHLVDGVCLRDESPSWAGLAIQGPNASAAFAKVFPSETLPPRNGIKTLVDGSVLCRTGYTGEDGFELFTPVSQGIGTWEKFLHAGVKPCGLGARDTLRLEMGYPLNGNDLSTAKTPLEAGLGMFCALKKPDFIGRNVLLEQKSSGLPSKLCALRYLDKGAPPRAHYPVTTLDGTVVGELASGALSPSLMTGIGLAYLPPGLAKPGTELAIDVRGRKFPASVCKKPFYKPGQTA